jgi:hypothetical protein
MRFNVFNCKIYRPAQLDWPWHSINRRDVAVSAVSIRLNEYCDVVSCLLVADVLVAGVFSAVWDVVGVSSVAYAETVGVLVLEPAAIAAAFQIVFFHILNRLKCLKKISFLPQQKPCSFFVRYTVQYSSPSKLTL